ncbi:MAG: T9SS C-terminal target domain-containing protein [Bacteroidetes bacterium]|nr:MAG: T9SS C-terminal target domain-containing protein [Bacteroidota bacterium]
MKTILPLLLGLLLPWAPSAQSGCTDPQALNYDPAATLNDGSCLYPPTSLSPDATLVLPEELSECSGLAWHDATLWSHNDSGNPPTLFQLNPDDGSILDSIRPPGTSNVDWEDLALGDGFLFVGDFGNNPGNRTDLRILRLPADNPLAHPDTIAFAFSDQTSFPNAPNAHNFDCEAFFYHDDSLHLFSKNWLDGRTRHYTLPAQPGQHLALLQDSLDVGGLLTAAHRLEDGTILLLGYDLDALEAFLYLLFDYPPGRIFAGNKRRISLGSLLLTGQTEGIAGPAAEQVYVCSESTPLLPPLLLRYDLSSFFQPPSQTASRHLAPCRVYPNPGAGALTLELPSHTAPPIRVRLHQTGRLLRTLTLNGPTPTLQLEDLPPVAGLLWVEVLDSRGYRCLSPVVRR